MKEGRREGRKWIGAEEVKEVKGGVRKVGSWEGYWDKRKQGKKRQR